ncbi:MAG: ClbS/DfsB family four-helix bundle protein [Anaerolineae bacterium]|nr:ClbS/DfsB family four-helix bundle protein [Anaerolineae bacterium]
MKDENDINARLYKSNRGRSKYEILDESRQVFQRFFATLDALPDDIQIDTEHHRGRDFHLVCLDDQRFLTSEFFDHFHDDHEPDIRA